MLESLHVKNLALIKEEEINFEPGLNVLSGETGAGKSVVMDYLKNHTCSEVVLADDLAKELMSPGHDLNQKLQKVLSKESFVNPVFEEDGTIRKEAFAAYVLSDDRLRESVNALVHPAVKEEVLRRVKAHREKKDVDYFFLEAALLIEDGYKALCDELWYIYVTEDNRRKRLKENRGYDDSRIDEAFRM